MSEPEATTGAVEVHLTEDGLARFLERILGGEVIFFEDGMTAILSKQIFAWIDGGCQEGEGVEQ